MKSIADNEIYSPVESQALFDIVMDIADGFHIEFRLEQMIAKCEHSWQIAADLRDWFPAYVWPESFAQILHFGPYVCFLFGCLVGSEGEASDLLFVGRRCNG